MNWADLPVTKKEPDEECFREAEKSFEEDAQKNAYNRKVNKEGNKLFLASEFTTLPDIQTGGDFQKENYPKQDWLFNGLVERGQRVILSGPWKSGKTTAFGYALKTICDGGSYMGVFNLEQDGKQNNCPVMYLNLEVTTRTMHNYLFQVIGIENPERLLIHNLLGYSVNILNEIYFEQLQQTISDRGICTLFIDPLRQFYSGDENDNSIAKEVTDRLDTIMKESDSLQNIFLSAHTGHANGLNLDESGFARPRGASKWADWADVLISLTRKGEDRFIAVRGRNGELAERRIRLTESGLRVDTEVNRGAAKIQGIESEVLALLIQQQGSANISLLKAGIQGNDANILGAVETLEGKGFVVLGRNPSDKRSKLVSLTVLGREVVRIDQSKSPAHLKAKVD